MAISDRITSIEEHIKESYQELEGIGIDTTEVNKNLENIPKLIDGYWETLPKVTGEGTSITLDNTKEGKMKIDLKGNTSQETTTGKNLLNNNGTSGTKNGVTYTINPDKSITLNGTSTQAFIFDIDNGRTLDAGTYTLSLEGKIQGCGIYLYVNQTLKTYVSSNNSSDNWKTNFTLDSTTTFNEIRIDVQNSKTFNNVTIYPMIRLASITDETYEPYTNGASPNPNYPQNIHVVSGDNSIDVCGKNLMSASIINGYGINASGVNYANNDWNTTIDFIQAKPSTTYTFSVNSSSASNQLVIAEYDKNKTFIVRSQGTSNTNYRTITTNASTKYVKVGYNGTMAGSTTLNGMLELGSSATTYEPYQGNTYNIDLPVENLLQNNLTSGTNNGITYVVNEDKSVTLNGTATAITWLILNSSVTLEAGTYTMTSGYSGNDVRVYSTGLGVYTLDGQRTVTKTSSVSGDVSINIPSGTICNNLTIKPMIEKGSKANSYIPYGTTPIELCKIGDYQDSIKKSTGKNLFDKDNLIANYRLGSDGTPFYQSGYSLTEYISVEPNTTYRRNIAFAIVEPVCLYDSGKTFISRITTGSSFTTTSETKYIRTAVSTDKINITQLEKGSSVSDYEPYGKVWYVNKQIGKVVFDGSESWSINTSYTYNVFYRTLDNYARISNTQTTYCEYYKGIENATGIADFGNNYNNSIGVRTANDNIKDIYISNNSITSASDFKTWLSTHNTVVYYVLATPTTTEITDSTLISQLEALSGAKSYTTQTNITQTNNDKPFILDITALKQLTQ